jgi:hypothetical protein
MKKETEPIVSELEDEEPELTQEELDKVIPGLRPYGEVIQ